MSTKAQSMAANKKKRKANRQKVKTKKAVVSAHQANVSNMIGQAVAQGQSLVGLANMLHEAGFKAKKGQLTDNDDVLKMLSEVTVQLTIVHGGVEIIERLLKEQGQVFPEAEQVIADQLDEAVIKLSEDANVIIAFIDEKKTLEDYLQMFLSFTDRVQELSGNELFGVYANVFTPHKDALREYLVEHMGQDEDSFMFSIPYHEKRANRVGEKYRTKFGEGDDIANLMAAPSEELFGAESEPEVEEAPAAPIQ